ncbi:MAG: DUF4215 domain-containing protein [Kofleriaceae bacterium]
MAIVILALTGCVQSAANTCVGDGVCPPGLHCGEAGGVQVCVPLTCGNGRLDPLEACDDGNTVSGDGCPAACVAPCGDGVLDPHEACDDGNTVSGDGCAADCQSNEACGNGVRDPDEACDDDNHQSHDGCSSQCTVEQDGWFALDVAPSARAGHAMAYDAARDRVVLFGGTADQAMSSETWLWDGATWRPRSPVVVPPPRTGHAMAYDPVRARVVMFGGSGLAGDGTWEWDGGAWREQLPAVAPSPRLIDPAMTYDAGRAAVVLFGGIDRRNGHDDLQRRTWAWDGAAWGELTTANAPPARAAHAMAYDARRGALVLFGGVAGAARLGDTWELDGAGWTLRASAGPPARDHAVMAFDATRGAVVLFGGTGDAGALNDTWAWDGAQWSAVVADAVPEARSGAAIAEARGALVLFGGAAPAPANDTWQWDGTRWSQRVIRAARPRVLNGAAYYDVVRARVVAILGKAAVASDPAMWEWDGTNWLVRDSDNPPPLLASTEVASDGTKVVALLAADELDHPSQTWTFAGRQWTHEVTPVVPTSHGAHALAYDAQRAETVMFGGFDAQGIRLAETWVWNGATWTQRHPAHQPPPRVDFVMAYDAGRKRVVLFGGVQNDFDQRLDDTWEWTGTDWVERPSAARPSAGICQAMAYDPGRGVMVMFGGTGDQPEFGDPIVNATWEWNGTTWTARPSQTMPLARCGQALVYDPRRQRIVMFGGGSAVDSLDDVWEWDGVDWRRVLYDTAPHGRAQTTLVYDAAHANVVLFGGARQFNGPFIGAFGDTWIWDGTAWHEQLTAQAPTPRSQHAIAYDPARGVTVLFGGGDRDLSQRQPDGINRFDDTWEWDGRAWRARALDVHPGLRRGAAMAYDGHRLMMFGGDQVGDAFLAETWTWDGASWREIVGGQVPPARSDFGLAYDAARGRVVLFGGHDTGGPRGDLWEWDGATWIERTPVGPTPSVRSAPSLAYDPRRQRVVMFGGQISVDPYPGSNKSVNDLWAWDGTRWTELALAIQPPVRSYAALVDDAAREQLMLLGGNDDGTTLGDAWVLRTEDRDAPDQACHGGFDADGDGEVGCADPDCQALCVAGAP